MVPHRMDREAGQHQEVGLHRLVAAQREDLHPAAGRLEERRPEEAGSHLREMPRPVLGALLPTIQRRPSGLLAAFAI